MNNLAIALKDAGVKLPPMNRRIWQWLKDNGAHTLRDICAELGVAKVAAQAVVSVMLREGTLERQERHDSKGKRSNNAYAALGTGYNQGRKPPVVAAIKPQGMSPAGVDPEEALGTYTLSELRVLYQYLHKHFRA